MKSIEGRKVGVLGLGDENIALVNYLVKHEANVFVLDQKKKEELGDYLSQISNLPIQYRLGPDYLENLEDFEVIFRTPGLPYFHSKIQAAKKAGIEVTSEIRLFFSLCPCPIIGVTGTKGKGTTATLIYEILKWKYQIQNNKLQKKVYLGGNIGNPPIEFLEKLKLDDIVILELSSFQLQDLEQSPHFAVVLDIKEDHLDHHKNISEYIKAKENIVSHQEESDYAVINNDYEVAKNIAELTRANKYFFSRKTILSQGVWVNDKNDIILKVGDIEKKIINVHEVKLRGKHNLENICAAVLASALSGAKIEDIQKTVKEFKGLEHRLELVRKIEGINFYNDSFSTTPDTTIAAIESFYEPIILLIGGSEKKADYKKLASMISASTVKMIISIGFTSKRILSLLNNNNIKIINEIKSMDEAVKLTMENAESGDIILLSPASASFDRYKNYKDRGNQFKKAVLDLK